MSHWQVHAILKDLVRKAINETHVSFPLSYYHANPSPHTPPDKLSTHLICLITFLQELKQFPTLRVEVGNAAFESLDRMRDESKKNTLKLVDMECSYLTVDFFRKLPQDVEKGGNPSHSIFDRYNDSYLRRIGKTYMISVFLLNSLLCSYLLLNFSLY
jgi:hypothetical protein